MSDSFRSLVDAHAAGVYAQAFHLLGNRQEAEEATQDVFLAVARGLAGFRGDCALSTWIYRITYTTCLRRRRTSRLRKIIFAGSETVTAEVMADGDPDPQQRMEETEEHDALIRHLRSLPAVQATALTLLSCEGKSYKEISEILGIPPGSVATAIHRGRERLRLLMKGTP